jgi:hypothetical protein
MCRNNDTKMKRDQYASIDSIGNESYYYDDDRDYSPGLCCRIPCFILLPVILFAVFVGNFSTIAFSNKTKDVNISSTKMISQSDIKEAQKYAEEKFKEKLLKPCEEAEQFYNSTDKNKVIMSSITGKNYTESSPPPLPPKEGCVATILLFRHCEGGIAREHCGYMGNLRSQYIATLFGNTPDARWPEPNYIYAMSAGERNNEFAKNWREIETVEPLSTKVKISIDETYGFPEKKKFVDHLYSKLRKGEMCDKVIVISWKHHDIPHFTHSLGCGPENGCPMTYGEYDYEAVWQLTYSYHREKYAPYVVEDTTAHGLKKKKPWGLYPQWFVYGTIQQEGFDPLEFAKSNGSA